MARNDGDAWLTRITSGTFERTIKRRMAHRLAKVIDDQAEYLKSRREVMDDSVVYAFELLANAIREEFGV